MCAGSWQWQMGAITHRRTHVLHAVVQRFLGRRRTGGRRFDAAISTLPLKAASVTQATHDFTVFALRVAGPAKAMNPAFAGIALECFMPPSHKLKTRLTGAVSRADLHTPNDFLYDECYIYMSPLWSHTATAYVCVRLDSQWRIVWPVTTQLLQLNYYMYGSTNVASCFWFVRLSVEQSGGRSSVSSALYAPLSCYRCDSPRRRYRPTKQESKSWRTGRSWVLKGSGLPVFNVGWRL